MEESGFDVEGAPASSELDGTSGCVLLCDTLVSD